MRGGSYGFKFKILCKQLLALCEFRDFLDHFGNVNQEISCLLNYPFWRRKKNIFQKLIECGPMMSCSQTLLITPTQTGGSNE